MLPEYFLDTFDVVADIVIKEICKICLIYYKVS